MQLAGAESTPGADPSGSGAPRLQLFDETGRVRVALSTTESGQVLAFADAAGRNRIAIHLTPAGTPSLDVLDAAGLTRFRLSSSTDGGAVLIFADSAGRVRVGMDGTPSLLLMDGGGKVLFGYP